MKIEKLTNEKVAKYKPWVKSIVAKSMRIYPVNPRWDANDLESEAWIGFMESWIKFDKSKGVPFKAYARRQIINKIQSFFSANVFTLHGMYDNIKKNPDELTRMHDVEIGAVRGYSESEDRYEHGGSKYSIIESGYYNTEKDAIKKELKAKIREEVNSYDPWTKKLINMKFVEDKSLFEMAKELGCSHEHIRMTLISVQDKIKEKLENRGW